VVTLTRSPSVSVFDVSTGESVPHSPTYVKPRKG
jgi:hypothetical protein